MYLKKILILLTLNTSTNDVLLQCCTTGNVVMFTTSQFRILNLCPGQELAAAGAKGERVREIPPTVGSPLQQPVLAKGEDFQWHLLLIRRLLGSAQKPQGAVELLQNKHLKLVCSFTDK